MIDKKLPITKQQLRILAMLLVANSIYAVAWLGIHKYHNPVIELAIDAMIIFIALKASFSRALNDKKNYRIVWIYFVWMLLQSLRGFIGCVMYMDYRQLIDATVMLSLPILVFLFAYPTVVQYVLRKWLIWGGLVFLIFILWNTGPNCLYLAPIALFACFYFELPLKWKIVIGIILLAWISTVMDRANLIRTVMMLVCALGFRFKRIISSKILHIVHSLFYILPLVLLMLGYLGNFNFFQYIQEDNNGKHTEVITYSDGSTKEVDIFGDTRTFIYEEVLASSIKHKHVLWGRTPARGNDDYFFESLATDGKGHAMRPNERHVNEVGHLNVYTWIGLIGILLYSLIYFRASTLAVYKSQNNFIRFLGVFIAFRWCMGWIEEINTFFIQSIVIWMMIAMCMSERFRKMKDQDFRVWFSKCLPI